MRASRFAAPMGWPETFKRTGAAIYTDAVVVDARVPTKNSIRLLKELAHPRGRVNAAIG